MAVAAPHHAVGVAVPAPGPRRVAPEGVPVVQKTSSILAQAVRVGIMGAVLTARRPRLPDVLLRLEVPVSRVIQVAAVVVPVGPPAA